MNLPKAFFTSRVTETLDSLATHVASAYNTSADLKSLRIAKLNLDEEESSGPIFTSLSPTTVKPVKGQPIKFTVTGKRLGRVKNGKSELKISQFELIPESDPSAPRAAGFSANTQFAATLDDKSKSIVVGFEANVTFPKDAAGSYDVRITDSSGRQHLPGFTVVVKQEKVTGAGTPGTTVKAPSIRTHPKKMAVSNGQTAKFSVSATGDSMVFQWFKDGNPIAGATKNTWSKSAVQGDAGHYTVAVANSGGIVMSNPALLEVK